MSAEHEHRFNLMLTKLTRCLPQRCHVSFACSQCQGACTENPGCMLAVRSQAVMVRQRYLHCSCPPSLEESPDHTSCGVNSKSHTLLACSMKTQGHKLVRKCEKEKPTLGSRGLRGLRAHHCTGKKDGGGAAEQASGDKSLRSCRFTVLN